MLSDDSFRTEKSNECIWECLGPGIRLGYGKGGRVEAGRVNEILEGEREQLNLNCVGSLGVGVTVTESGSKAWTR